MKSVNLSLAAKLWVAICILIALLVVTLLVGAGRTSALRKVQDAAAVVKVANIAKIAQWVGLIETNVTRVEASAVSSDPAVDDLYKDKIPATIARISEIQKSIEGADLRAEDKALFAQIGEERKVVLASLAKAREVKKAGDQAAAVQEIKTVFVPAVDKYVKSLQQFADSQTQGFALQQAEFIEQRVAGGRFEQAMVALLILVMLGGTWMLIRQIREPLRDAISVAETIADGNLNVKVDTSRGDEFGEMMKAIDHMRDQLTHLVADVRRGTDSISTASEEIATGNQDLANRTEQTASSLEKTASSMEQLTATVKQSADSAQQANQMASSAASVAQRGGDVVSQVVTTMNDINVSSRKISDIISVIDGIAFQTNILALNAAVEAARAGEQGRGFAVVASEVRSLAGRSADAAKEIKSLINASVEKVEGGSRLVADAGQTMTEIVSAVQRVTDIMGEISAAASEQFAGITEVNGAVGHLDQMTQQNAALVEQSAAAASSMKDQAHRLAQVVAKFKLDGAVNVSQHRAAIAAKPAQAQQQIAAPRAASAPAKRPPAVKAAPARPALPAAKPAPVPAKSNASVAAASKSDDDWETF